MKNAIKKVSVLQGMSNFTTSKTQPVVDLIVTRRMLEKRKEKLTDKSSKESEMIT
jgi:hypothetical protein